MSIVQPSPDAVSTELRGCVLVVSLSNPPVNAISAAVRRRLLHAIDLAQQDPACHAIVLMGAGKQFSGGADIREFSQPRLPPSLPDLCDRLESSAKPVIAALHGACLGGALELALAAHYRIAAPDARLGLPEVTLGLLPGAGGTQRTPRITGVQWALELMLSGKPVSGEQGARAGLIDRLAAAGADLEQAAIAYAHELLATNAGPRPTRQRTEGLAAPSENRSAIEAARREAQTRFRGRFSPFKIIDAVERSLDAGFDQGMAFERAAFLDAVNSSERAGLVHAFFAERTVAKVPEADQAQPRPVASVGVIGGGTMGAGIAVALLDAGYPVVMIERDDAAVQRGRGLVEKVYDGLVAKGRIGAAARQQTLARFRGETSYEALRTADLVIEAVFEDLAVKKEVFACLDRVCKPGCVLATNTSYLDIDAIAASISRPREVLGLHFFSPANIMKLLEVVVPAHVAPDVVATGFALARRLDKVAVRAGVCDGFIGNRILAAYRLAIDYMIEDGASPYQVDRAMRDFGYPMGPLQVSDLSGGDIGWATRKRRAATRDPRQRYVRIADRLCEKGWFGQKTGRGWYLYPEGGRAGVPDPEVEAIVESERATAGIAPLSFTDPEIVRRVLCAMVNEGCHVLQEKIALRPLDVDVVFVHGYGFPRYRGGPMHYADGIGLRNVLQDIRGFAREDAFFWRPAPLLVELAESGRTFDSLNQSAAAAGGPLNSPSPVTEESPR